MKSPNLNEFSIMDSQKKVNQLNLVSPVIKHSRGARFLDLVKNNKLNVSPQLNKRLSVNKNVVKDLMEKSEKKEDYLKFSVGTPSLSSSPSSGILSKRKQTMETPDSPSTQNSAKVCFDTKQSFPFQYFIYLLYTHLFSLFILIFSYYVRLEETSKLQ